MLLQASRIAQASLPAFILEAALNSQIERRDFCVSLFAVITIVSGLKPLWNESGGMRFSHRVGNLNRHVDGPPRVDSLPGQFRSQRSALQEFKGHDTPAVVLTNIEDRDRVGM